MPWTKKFDIDTALDQAKQVFWHNGYEVTSMQDLLDAMGINRGSFYDTFKSKKDLYIKVLKRYDAQARDVMFKAARNIDSPSEAILFIFRETVDLALKSPDRAGCFLANSALDMAPRDGEAGKVVRDAFSNIRNVLRMLIEEAKEKGEIRPETDAKELASTLLSLLLGLKVLARAAPDKEVLEANVAQVERIIAL